MQTTQGDPHPSPDGMLKAALDAALDGHALWSPILDTEGRLVDLRCSYINPAGAVITGRRAADLVGIKLLESSRFAGDGDIGRAMFEVARTGVALRRRIRLTRASGDQTWLDVAAVGLSGGLSVSYRDVTAEVHLQTELQEAVKALKRLAATDPLTGLANRRAWSQALADHLQRAVLGKGSLVVALLDLDQFKAYNDRYGHPAGDQLLVEVAASWEQHLPPDATLARLGGEEFAVALPDTDLPSAQRLLTELCALVPAGQTSSAGLTSWDGTESEASLLGRADAALYAAKHAGRNRVEALLAL